MQKTLPVLILLLVASPCLAGEVVRTLNYDYVLASGQGLHLDIPVAEVSIDGTDGDLVSAELRVECNRASRRCHKWATELRLVDDSERNYLNLELDGYPEREDAEPQIDLRLSVPRDRLLEIEMGVGELEIRDMESDIAIDLGVGEVDLLMPESAVRRIEVEVGIGEARLSPRRHEVRESGFLGTELEWRDGRGNASIEIDVGVGEVEIDLE